mmetsp:Transcript_51426/g.153765  ORF Transcript_51426/g.153765 Transcript_51426/m.153765 type:complete len:227 (+) Transcript_51426:128-808(+)
MHHRSLQGRLRHCRRLEGDLFGALGEDTRSRRRRLALLGHGGRKAVVVQTKQPPNAFVRLAEAEDAEVQVVDAHALPLLLPPVDDRPGRAEGGAHSGDDALLARAVLDPLDAARRGRANTCQRADVAGPQRDARAPPAAEPIPAGMEGERASGRLVCPAAGDVQGPDVEFGAVGPEAPHGGVDAQQGVRRGRASRDLEQGVGARLENVEPLPLDVHQVRVVHRSRG